MFEMFESMPSLPSLATFREPGKLLITASTRHQSSLTGQGRVDKELSSGPHPSAKRHYKPFSELASIPVSGRRAHLRTARSPVAGMNSQPRMDKLSLLTRNSAVIENLYL